MASWLAKLASRLSRGMRTSSYSTLPRVLVPRRDVDWTPPPTSEPPRWMMVTNLVVVSVMIVVRTEKGSQWVERLDPLIDRVAIFAIETRRSLAIVKKGLKGLIKDNPTDCLEGCLELMQAIHMVIESNSRMY